MFLKLTTTWLIAVASTAAFLLGGIYGPFQMTGFFAAQVLAIGMTYMIYLSLIGGDRSLRKKVVTRGFSWFLIMTTAIPLIGPAVGLFIVVFLKFFPVYPVRTESFEKINRDVLLVTQKRFQTRTLPLTEALLIRTLQRDDALRMVAIVGEMSWQPVKSSVLRYIIRLSPFQNVILMAIDLLRKKMDGILSEIADLEPASAVDYVANERLAMLYHEVVYLDLCEPIMKDFYLNQSCDYAVKALNAGGNSEDDALTAVKYLLEADRVSEAYAIYQKNRDKGAYFFPKWITYEFEFSVRQNDKDRFSDLYLLIEAGGGVFIPDRVKAAAKAWQRYLTSAWL